VQIRQHPTTAPATKLWVEQLRLANFRNYSALGLKFGPEPIVLVGPNGAGKTNLMEAVSLLAAGQGLRRSPFSELARAGGSGDWAVAARLNTHAGTLDVGTGLQSGAGGASRNGRVVKVNGEAQGGSGVLADLVEMLWVTPAMDGLFTGPGADRRRFLDRLILCFDPGYRTRLGHFERAMTQRNRLLSDNVRNAAQFDGLERVLAETGVAIAAARAEAVAQLGATIRARKKRLPGNPFPWAMIDIVGDLEERLAVSPAVDVEDQYCRQLAVNRARWSASLGSRRRTRPQGHAREVVLDGGAKSAAGRTGARACRIDQAAPQCDSADLVAG
jgi:DNA replication and repair protein RecF